MEVQIKKILKDRQMMKTNVKVWANLILKDDIDS